MRVSVAQTKSVCECVIFLTWLNLNKELNWIKSGWNTFCFTCFMFFSLAQFYQDVRSSCWAPAVPRTQPYLRWHRGRYPSGPTQLSGELASLLRNLSFVLLGFKYPAGNRIKQFEKMSAFTPSNSDVLRQFNRKTQKFLSRKSKTFSRKNFEVLRLI